MGMYDKLMNSSRTVYVNKGHEQATRAHRSCYKQGYKDSIGSYTDRAQGFITITSNNTNRSLE